MRPALELVAMNKTTQSTSSSPSTVHNPFLPKPKALARAKSLSQLRSQGTQKNTKKPPKLERQSSLPALMPSHRDHFDNKSVRRKYAQYLEYLDNNPPRLKRVHSEPNIRAATLDHASKSLEVANASVGTSSSPRVGISPQDQPKEIHFDAGVSASSSSNPILGTIKNSGNWLLNQVVNEIGWNSLTSGVSAGTNFNLATGAALGIRFNEKVIEPTDPTIADSDIRLLSTREMEQQSGRKIVWIETAGVLELGSGMQGSIPLAAVTAHNCGFTASGFIRYRSLQPYEMGGADTASKLVGNSIFGMPMTASSAVNMKAGAEFELTGQGKFTGDATLGIIPGLPLGPGILGGGAMVTGDGTAAQEYAIKVTSIDGANRVRVTVRQLNQIGMGINARLLAGIIFPPGAVVPPAGAGLLKYMAEKVGYHTVEDLATNFTSLTVAATAKATRTASDIACFDFDLSTPEAKLAYNDLVRLSSRRASELAKTKSSGVTRVLLSERDYTGELGAVVSLFGQKLFLAKLIYAARHGHLTNADGSSMFYRESAHEKQFSNWFKYKTKINWESLIFEPSDNSPDKIYYHFQTEKRLYRTQQSDVDNFSRFMGTMHMDTDGPVSRDLVKTLSLVRSLFSSKDDSVTRMDIYFTADGVKRLANCPKALAKDTYLSTAVRINGEFEACPISPIAPRKLRMQALEILNEYIEEKAKTSFFTFGTSLEVKRLEQDYWALTGRPIKDDLTLLKQAEQFAEQVEKLKDAKTSRQIANFFTTLINQCGDNYMHTISALSNLVGKEDTLVHNLSMQGAGISLQSIDEGKITHPREEFSKLMDKVSLITTPAKAA
jgi:hypothetical protein